VPKTSVFLYKKTINTRITQNSFPKFSSGDGCPNGRNATLILGANL
jgi:hypothetical protein